MSIFITLEGNDRIGKSTQAALLYDELRMRGFPVILMRQPGGVVQSTVHTLPALIGEELRDIVTRRDDVPPEVETHLFFAGFADAAYRILLPFRNASTIIISDRWVDSWVAYQWSKTRQRLQDYWSLLATVTYGIVPVLTILLDANPLRLARDPSRGPSRLVDFRDMRYHGTPEALRIREAYHRLVAIDPHRWHIVDAEQSVAAIHHAIMARVEGMLCQEIPTYLNASWRPSTRA